jgi:hypothetical protein
MVKLLRWLNASGLLPAVALVALSVFVIGEELVPLRAPEQGQQEKLGPKSPVAVADWEEPVPVPIEELETRTWENSWVIVQGVVTSDGAHGLDWVGIAPDGQKMRVLLLFRKRDFRRCRPGETVTVEGFHRGRSRGVVELVECRFQDLRR